MSETATLHVHTDHLADLAKSGLTEADARAAGLYSASPGEVPRLTGRQVPDETSCLVIPYHGCDGFVRVKPFPPLLNADGKPIRYLQRAGTGCRLYVPPSVAPLLADPAHPLAITEGEKKALAITKAGWPCVGTGGIWNFTTDGELISDLKAIPWRSRIVRLIADADVWWREDLLLAVFRFARLLEAEEATVFIVKLPALPEIEKTGADDFLVAKGPAAFRRLMEKPVTLGYAAFKVFREQEKRVALQAASAKVPPELAGRRIHPALHYEEDLATIGIVEPDKDVGGLTCTVFTSNRTAYPIEALTPILTTPANAFKPLSERWPLQDRREWLADTGRPASFALATGAALALFTKLLDAPPSTLAVLAVWTVATYFFPLFAAFPRLFITGEKESGKSKAEQIIAGLAWNGLYCVVPTGPTLFRLIEAVRPTFCISEAEHVDSEQRQVLQAIVNEGYKAGGWAPRCDKETLCVGTFDVYGPLALGRIKGLNVVTESRAISLVMQRGTDRAKMNAEVYPDSDDFRAIRCQVYRLALERFRDVATTAATLADPPWMVGRERELWRPLLILAHLADSESRGTLNLTAAISQAAKAQTDDRAGPSEEAEALVNVLDARLGEEDEIRLHPGDLVENLKAKLHREHLSSAFVGHLLRRNGFQKPPKPGDRDAEGVFYLVSREQVEAIKARYDVPPEQPTYLHTSKTYTTQPIDNEQVATSNVGM